MSNNLPPLSQDYLHGTAVPSLADINHPAAITVNVQDSKNTQGFSQQGFSQQGFSQPNVDDRQHPDETDNQLKQYPEQKHDAKWWAYRVFVGKDYYHFEKEKQTMKKKDWLIREFRYHLAEFIGTLFLIMFVCGIQVNQDFFPTGGVANIDKGIISGFILTALIYAFGKVSGAHFNPLVTIAFLLRGSFNLFRTITYIAVQFGGAVSGAALLYHWFGNVGPGLGTTVPGPGVQDYAAVEIELCITFILITVILSTTEQNHKIVSAVAGLAVGSTFAATQILAWNMTGASVNPWRTIGPTIISGVGWDTYWIYIVGPISGMILAVIVERIMMTGVDLHHKKKKPIAKSATLTSN